MADVIQTTGEQIVTCGVESLNRQTEARDSRVEFAHTSANRASYKAKVVNFEYNIIQQRQKVTRTYAQMPKTRRLWDLIANLLSSFADRAQFLNGCQHSVHCLRKLSQIDNVQRCRGSRTSQDKSIRQNIVYILLTYPFGSVMSALDL